MGAIGQPQSIVIDFFEYVCVTIFTVELSARFFTIPGLFCSKDERWWALFDCFLVLAAWIEILMVIGGARNSQLSGTGATVGKAMKMFRMARILRVIRIVHFLSPLRILVQT